MAIALSRKDLLKAGGALVVGFAMRPLPTVAAIDELRPRQTDRLKVDSWLVIAPNGDVTIYSGKIDGGVGIRTAFTQIVSDELDVPMHRITIIMGDTAITPNQDKSTASTGISTGVQPLRVASAEARNALVQLAAARLSVAATDLETRDGLVVVKALPSRSVAYGDLIGDRTLSIDLVMQRETPWGPLLKVKTPLQSYKVRKAVGKSVKRLDTPAKVAGTFEYVHNVRVPGMLHGRVIRPPANGAKLLSVDERSIHGIAGVRIVREADFLGVVAEREENAIRAATQLKASWGPGTPLPDQRAQYDDLRHGKVLGQLDTTKRGGDVDVALKGATRKFTAAYNFPYQMHGMLGPSCAVVDVRPGRVTVWSGTQWPSGTLSDVARMLKIDPKSVEVIWREASGSYGRLGVDDAACDAALMSSIVGKPVRVQWMRHDEHGFEPPSPGVAFDLEAALDGSGNISAFSLVAHAMSTAVAEAGNTMAWRLLGTAPGSKRFAGYPEDSAYEIPSLRFRAIYVEGPHRPIFMRAPGLQQSVLAIEGFMDELAEAAGVNPIEFRLKHITHPRDRAALLAAFNNSGWNGLPSRTRGANQNVLTGHGVAFIRWGAEDTRLATVAQIEVERSTGIVRVKRLSVGHDCGLHINPDGVLNQVQGATLQGMSRTLHEEWKFDSKGVTSLDWHSYPIVRFSEVPELKITLLSNPDDTPTGAGESGSVPLTGAIGNAIYDATGRRPREAPFTPERIRALLA